MIGEAFKGFWGVQLGGCPAANTDHTRRSPLKEMEDVCREKDI